MFPISYGNLQRFGVYKRTFWGNEFHSGIETIVIVFNHNLTINLPNKVTVYFVSYRLYISPLSVLYLNVSSPIFSHSLTWTGWPQARNKEGRKS